MNDLPIPTLENVISEMNGVGARLIAREQVKEAFEGKTVWEGEVLIFRLVDHPRASRCYAWEVNGAVTSLLHTPPVESPRSAVRAWVLANGSPKRMVFDAGRHPAAIRRGG